MKKLHSLYYKIMEMLEEVYGQSSQDNGFLIHIYLSFDELKIDVDIKCFLSDKQ